ncbi:SDH family Clp fold serine proteinase [Methylobacterium oryzisoli]|uniref:SDH family Clp fold serine proteinase n=1 Tax=Methylobacterium oryzisoli TaxID=3385502 RepID=UPI0038912F41
MSDLDMNGLMAVVHGLDRSKGLDLVLHTPGGGIEAGRAMVEYLYKMFGTDLRVLIPHMAMSVGTMMACAARQIFMAKHSCLGPTDPQINGLPAMGILAEVDTAIEDIKHDPVRQVVWQAVFAKYPPAFILDCERSVKGARAMVKGWLAGNMFAHLEDPEAAAEAAVGGLMSYSENTEHGEHYLIDKCRTIGLNVVAVEDDQELQENLLSVHHSYMATFARTQAVKLIENSAGNAWVIG